MAHAIPLLSLSLTYCNRESYRESYKVRRKSYKVRRTICSRAPHDKHVPGLSVIGLRMHGTLVLVAHNSRTS
jgi:hypothetical protein